MKASTRLTKYFLRQSSRIYRLLHIPLASFEEKDFHMLRVHIKKIKAILALLESSVNDFPRGKHYKPYKAIFDQAGKVRELQLQLSLMKKYKASEILKPYYSQLDTHVTQYHQEFLSLVTKKLKRKLRKNDKKILPVLKKVDADVINIFLSTASDRIDKSLHAEKLNAREVHTLRKQIKELNYLHRIFKQKNKRLAISDDFQELLGQWHDYDVISEDLIKDAQHHKLQPAVVKAIMTLQKKISTKADLLLRKIEVERHLV